MCIAAIAWQAHPRWQLVIAANRDEYHARPAAPLARWDDGSGIIAGRDLVGGGTWLGLTEGAEEGGRLVLVTNHRVPGYPQPDRPSRGGLVTALLDGADPDRIDIADYNPFNLLHVDGRKARFLTNWAEDRRMALPPGFHGLSNGQIDPPWLKTRRLSGALSGWLASDDPDFAPLFEALLDPTPTATEWADGGPEPRLSSIFIADQTYGTRCSTIVAIAADGSGRVVERSFGPGGTPLGEVALAFRWP